MSICLSVVSIRNLWFLEGFPHDFEYCPSSMVPVKHPVIIGNFSSKIAATAALMMGGIRTCVDRHAKQGLSV